MNMTKEERDLVEQRDRHRMEAEYKPISSAGRGFEADLRVADANEYIAFQLGQINRKMDALIAAIEKLAASK